MGLPSNFKKDINIFKKKVGPERRKELFDQIAENGTLLPKGVLHKDMDIAFTDFVKNEIHLVLEGETVPVLFLTIQRWSEFSKTWQFADQFKNIKIPFITIVRKPDAQVGTNQAGWWDIPGKPTFTYMKVPTWDGARKGVDMYKIPQPTSIDMNYEVRVFCNKLTDLNEMNKIILKLFKARQVYIKVNGHFMPIVLEGIGDESQISDFDNRKFYVQMYDCQLKGYLLDEKDFVVIPTVNRAMVMTELIEDNEKVKVKVKRNDLTKEVTLNLTFNPLSPNGFIIPIDFNMVFNTVTPILNIDSYVFKLNNEIVEEPFNVNVGDFLTIEIVRGDNNKVSKLVIEGNNNA